MELTTQQKIERLYSCVEQLEEADCLQQEVFGDSDVGYDNHTRIQDMIEDFKVDIAELRGRA